MSPSAWRATSLRDAGPARRRPSMEVAWVGVYSLLPLSTTAVVLSPGRTPGR